MLCMANTISLILFSRAEEVGVMCSRDTLMHLHRTVVATRACAGDSTIQAGFR